ncbi:MAG: pyruvate/2-oxoglutarate dehydrogenase complex dihydrolipoamide acyltransferase (E2) component [Parasphingorhabdus sp.]|jgi:pyruvate/2-oxoglutarate dehydrogenase complex dihydrolipoamide acyltransferase (E2) component|tara:strand:- start:805 stop:1032 length:228 start_codon:yes stop_codon:yes gene_type:complete
MDIRISDDILDDDAEAVITVWFVNSGEHIIKNALMVEIMAAKVQYEMVAPASGVLNIVSGVDAVVRKGDVIGSIS